MSLLGVLLFELGSLARGAPVCEVPASGSHPATDLRRFGRIQNDYTIDSMVHDAYLPSPCLHWPGRLQRGRSLGARTNLCLAACEFIDSRSAHS